jgi:hypothetical protein
MKYGVSSSGMGPSEEAVGWKVERVSVEAAV